MPLNKYVISLLNECFVELNNVSWRGQDARCNIFRVKLMYYDLSSALTCPEADFSFSIKHDNENGPIALNRCPPCLQ